MSAFAPRQVSYRHEDTAERAMQHAEEEAARPQPVIFPINGYNHAARMFARVPTHVVGLAIERRLHPRAALRLPLRLTRVNQREEPVAVSLLTKNISTSGVLFQAPRFLEPGMKVELEVGLVERPLGRGGVRMTTLAHVVRAELSAEPGWYTVAASFEDFSFERDEVLPPVQA
jgi:hypothetical protein